MTKYHINPETGRPGQCTATVRGCKYAVDGQIPEHYDTKEEARKAVEQVLSEKFGNVSAMKKNRPTTAIKKKPKNALPQHKENIEKLRDIIEQKEENKLGFNLNKNHSYKVPTISPQEGYMGSQGWRGEKAPTTYMPSKEIAKNIRNDIKEAVKAGYLPSNLKYSVRHSSASMSSSIDVKISGLGEDIDTHEYDTRYDRMVHKPEVKELIERVENIHNAYNSDSSNGMVDYFNRGYYGHVKVLNDSDAAYDAIDKSKLKLNKVVIEKEKAGMSNDEILDDLDFEFAKTEYYGDLRNYYEKNNIAHAHYEFTRANKRMPTKEENQKIKGDAMNKSYKEIDRLIERHQSKTKLRYS